MNDPLLKHCANLKSFADHIKRRKTFEMDLPCFLLSWLRNLQLIPLTQGRGWWYLSSQADQELFDHIKAIPQIWHPKTFNWSQKGRWSFGSLCCFAATHRWLETLKNVAYLEIIFTNYPSSVVCMKNEMKYSLKLYFSSIFSPL